MEVEKLIDFETCTIKAENLLIEQGKEPWDTKVFIDGQRLDKLVKLAKIEVIFDAARTPIAIATILL